MNVRACYFETSTLRSFALRVLRTIKSRAYKRRQGNQSDSGSNRIDRFADESQSECSRGSRSTAYLISLAFNFLPPNRSARPVHISRGTINALLCGVEGWPKSGCQPKSAIVKHSRKMTAGIARDPRWHMQKTYLSVQLVSSCKSQNIHRFCRYFIDMHQATRSKYVALS